MPNAIEEYAILTAFQFVIPTVAFRPRMFDALDRRQRRSRLDP
jgi:hypothetical protein